MYQRPKHFDDRAHNEQTHGDGACHHQRLYANMGHIFNIASKQRFHRIENLGSRNETQDPRNDEDGHGFLEQPCANHAAEADHAGSEEAAHNR